ncbi:MAG: GGDEF domain-containing protein [Leptolinea sp.]|nr:GGDEF domain-containing protein [Leptolinea sp.]
MENFKPLLYEAVLVAFGKILAKYDAFTQGVIMRDIGKEIIDYLNGHGFDFSESGSPEDLNTLIDLFVKNGFAESLDVTPADKGDNYIWKNLYGISAYKELYDLALNPFLACPLNLCMCYVAGKNKKKLVMHRKEFVNDSITEAQYELVDDNTPDANLDELVLKSARLFEIADEKQKLFHHQALTDTLTGLSNIRCLEEKGKRFFNRAKEDNTPLAVLMCDIDFFKQVNDTYGHCTGDDVLRKLADIFRNSVRETDIICRYGGEEFVVLLPNTPEHRAIEIAERLRQGVEEAVFDDGLGGHIYLTISIGLNPNGEQAETLETAIQRADKALFRAKHEGRNAVVVWHN